MNSNKNGVVPPLQREERHLHRSAVIGLCFASPLATCPRSPFSGDTVFSSWFRFGIGFGCTRDICHGRVFNQWISFRRRRRRSVWLCRWPERSLIRCKTEKMIRCLFYVLLAKMGRELREQQLDTYRRPGAPERVCESA